MRYLSTAQTLEEAWLKALRIVITHGTPIQEKEPFKEIQNLCISYTNAFETSHDEYTYAFGTEFLDYIHRVYSPTGDQKSGRNYYDLIYKQSGINQVENIIQHLRTDPLTRSATIVLASAKAEKQPCVTEINFSIRNNLLHMSSVFKSSDLAKKFVPDLLELSTIHREISHRLHTARGEVTAHILSAQVYEKDERTVVRTAHKRRLRHYFKTGKVIENWNKEAETWDRDIKKPGHYVNIENGYRRFLAFLDDSIVKVRNTKMALDSGCGTGAIADALASKGYQVIGLDISPKMLEFAHKGARSTQYIQANSLDLPYGDKYFDIICSRGVLISHVGRKYVSLFLNEHHRVLKPGGLFMFDFITHFNPSEGRYRRNKAAIHFKTLSSLLASHGFEVIQRSGEDTNRVNAILCRKATGSRK